MRARRRWLLVAGAGLVLVLLAGLLFGLPAALRWALRERALPRVARKLGRPITVGQVRAGWRRIRLERVALGGRSGGGAPVTVASVVVHDYAILPLLRGRLKAERIELERPRLKIVRDQMGRTDVDDLLELARRGRHGRAGATPSSTPGARVTVGELVVAEGEASLRDARLGVDLQVDRIALTLRGGGRAGRGILFGVRLLRSKSQRVLAAARKVQLERVWLRPLWPTIRLVDAAFHPLGRLSLTGIRGTVMPEGDRLWIDLEGGYGGAAAVLWAAEGWADPQGRAGRLKLRAARFRLDRIASILDRTPIIAPEETRVSGRVEIALNEGTVRLEGDLGVRGLNLFHPRLAYQALRDISGALRVDLAYDLDGGRLQIDEFAARSGPVLARLTGEIEELGAVPRLDLRLVVPPIPCQSVLETVPRALVPKLKGFALRGEFAVDVAGAIDFDDLGGLSLDGDVGLDGCKVAIAPERMQAEGLSAPFDHLVESAPGEMMTVLVGPENPDFVPVEEVSPHVISAFLTTEDAAFYRHHGFISSQFRVALARNLQRGGFRLGASTITMQMVKNVLLSHQKTLSRKLQEMFLTWYLERHLSKSRIMEIWLNAIEFGPGLYGVGKAARHYFGKSAEEITPLEAAFFASILPNPRGRYLHYCAGELSPKWADYLRRILRRMHERGHLTDAELETAESQELTFDRDFERLDPAICREQVERLVDGWREERQSRLRQAILNEAPDKLPLYLPETTAGEPEAGGN